MAPVPYFASVQGRLGTPQATSAMVVVFSATGSATTFTTTPLTTQFVTTTFVTDVSISTKSLVTLNVGPSVLTLPMSPVPLSVTIDRDFTTTEVHATIPGTLTINDLSSFHISTPAPSGTISSQLPTAHKAPLKVGLIVGVIFSILALVVAGLALSRRRRRVLLGGTPLSLHNTRFPSRDRLYQQSNETLLSLEESPEPSARGNIYSDTQRSELTKLTRERNAARTALVQAASAEQGELERYVQDLERRLTAMQSRLDAAQADGEQPPPYVPRVATRIQSVLTAVGGDKRHEGVQGHRDEQGQ